jgi:hypothetical protein
MGPKRKYNNRDNSKNKKTDLTGTPPVDSDSDSDATSISLQETPPRSQTPLLSDSDEEGSEKEEEGSEKEEEGLSQEDQDFVQALIQDNEGIEEDAIDALVEDVEASQSQSELSQSQSQEILDAIESHNCSADLAKEIQDIENRLIHPSAAEGRITQLYLELLRSSGENIQKMLENLKQAIQRMISSSTATAMFEQINEHVIPLVRTVATTCVGYYLGSYLLRYVGGIISNLLSRHTTITLISLGSAGVHIVYNIGTAQGGVYLEEAVAAVNANIETFLTGVSRIGGITESTRQTMRTHTLDAIRDNVQNAINQATGDYQETEMADIKSLLENLDSNDSEFQEKIKQIQDRLNKLMAPVDVTEQGDNEDDFDNFGGKRVKRNRTKKTKAKKTVKRKAKKAKKTKKAKKAKKAKKTKKTKST